MSEFTFEPRTLWLRADVTTTGPKWPSIAATVVAVVAMTVVVG